MQQAEFNDATITINDLLDAFAKAKQEYLESIKPFTIKREEEKF